MEENPKLKNSNSKTKERRLPNPQIENPLKRNNKAAGFSKYDLSHLTPPQNFDVNSSVKKIFHEANKIVKIGIEKEFALQEKTHTLQSSNETIDNLRKNILHLQMEYEKLDQNYQREISTRSEIVKRMDSTRDIVESMVQYSNTLASSIKLLEDDKCRIVEYYELIYQGQKEIEAKHTEATKFIKEIDSLFNSKIEDLKNFYDRKLSQNSETISQLNRNLSYAADKLKISAEENEKLQTKITDFQEMVGKMESALKAQQNLNNMNQKCIFKLKLGIKKLKNQRLKYQKILKDKKKKICHLLNCNNTQAKNLKNMQDLLEKSISANKVLESKNYEWERKFENQLQEEALQTQNWEIRVLELNNIIKLLETEREELNVENKNLNEKVLELTKNEKEKDKEIGDLQADLSKMLTSNLNLQEDFKNLSEETMQKENKILGLEAKIADFGSKLNSEALSHHNEAETYQEIIKKLESQLSDAEKKLSLEKNQKEVILSDNNRNLENLKTANEKINNLEILVEDKKAYIKKIELQHSTLTLDGKKALEKLNKDLQTQKGANKELSSDLKNLEMNYSAVKKELQEAQNQISDIKEKLNEEKSLNKELKSSKNELEKNAAILKQEIECEKYSMQELQENLRKAEKELTELRKAVEENASLKAAVVNLKTILKATEARVEAYKVVVKKLETEKTEVKCSQVDENSKLKLELHSQEEARENTPKFSSVRTSQENFEQTEDEPQAMESEKWHKASSTPVRDSKKEALPPALHTLMLRTTAEATTRTSIRVSAERPGKSDAIAVGSRGGSGSEGFGRTPPNKPGQSGVRHERLSKLQFLRTPRKIFTSTPQPGARSLRPFKKQRDPYDFDSDSSVERFNPEQVMKVFNLPKENRQKKETNKKSKTNK